MKYKKLLLFTTSLIFIITLVFSLAYVFRVAEINVKCNELSGSNEPISEMANLYLEDYYQENIIFLNKNRIKEDLENISGYIEVKKVEKKYPNKLIVEIVERREVYSFKSGNDFWALNESFNVITKKSENVNNLTGLPNVEIVVNLADYDDSKLIKGGKLSLYDNKTAESFNIIKQLVVERKENLKSITVNVRSDGKVNRYLLVTMTEGMVFQIDKSDEFLMDKLLVMFEFYDAFENKGDEIKRYVTKLDSGEIKVV
ncbi:MAG: FtsQ-type POTRA domain-containing protein [Clostridia bacterium]|nr:FtsQ-type POTRA domain-containing protein [Clostridia bacterium]